MRNRILICIGSAAFAALLTGCASSGQRVLAVQPDGGAVRIFNKPDNIVFPAAVRAMHDHGEDLWEAREDKGRIVSLGLFGAQGVFLTSLPNGRTRVELSSSFGGSPLGGLFWGPDKFFSRLKELIVVSEKKAEIIKQQKIKIKIDSDLRNTYRKEEVTDKKTETVEEPAAAPPAPRGRIHRFRRR